MRSVGTFEAKTHLSALLEQVERGEEITITRHGKAVARLVPVDAVSQDRLERYRGAAEELPARAPARRSVREGADRGRATVTGCVIDASSVLAWCFEDEGGPEADALIEPVAAEGAAVPGMWSLEVANGLVAARAPRPDQPAESAAFVAHDRGAADRRRPGDRSSAPCTRR